MLHFARDFAINAGQESKNGIIHMCISIHVFLSPISARMDHLRRDGQLTMCEAALNVKICAEYFTLVLFDATHAHDGSFMKLVSYPKQAYPHVTRMYASSG